jgi:4-amino-4-deoxy-L-arabinose transferase-like glycosyltransferase
MIKHKERIYPFILFILLIFLSFICLNDTREFRPDDESIYVHIAREMYTRGELWIPTWVNQLAFYKPPLVYWIIMLGFICKGFSLFAARIPIALLSMATVMLTYLLGKDLYGKREGTIAAVLTATTLGFVIFGRIAMMDLPLCFFITCAVYSFHRAREKGAWILLFFLAAGLSTLIKGPISFLIIVTFGLLYSLIFREWRILFQPLSIIGLLLAIAGLALWPLAIYLKGYWNEWFSFFVIRENLGKFQDMHYPGYLMLTYYLLYLFPWSPLIISSCWLVISKKLYTKKEIMFPFLWALVILVIHLLPATKLKHYVIPAIPAGCLLITAIEQHFRKEWPEKMGRGILFATLIILFVLLCALFRITHGWLNFTLLTAALGSLLVSFLALRKDGIIETTAVFYGIALIFLIPFTSSLCFDRLPHEAIAYLQGRDTGVVHLQTHVYTLDLGKYTPQITYPSEFNEFLKKGGRLIISETSLSRFKKTPDFAVVPTRAVYSWKEWKKYMPFEEVLSVLWKGDTSPLIENTYIVEIEPEAPGKEDMP